MPSGAPAAVVLALGSARAWIGRLSTSSSAPPTPINLVDLSSAGSLAAQLSHPEHLPVSGALVVVVGARVRSTRAALLHALLSLLGAARVAFISDASAARIAADVPRALVVDVGESETRVVAPGQTDVTARAEGGVEAVREGLEEAVWDAVARSLVCGQGEFGDVTGEGGRVLLPGAERTSRPERLFDEDDESNVAVAVLRALQSVRVLDRADGGDIVLSGGGGEIAGLGPRLLAAMRDRCATDDRFAHLRKVIHSAAVMHTPFAAGMLPWVGGVVTAKAGGVGADVVVEKGEYRDSRDFCLVDDDAIDRVG